MLADLQGVVAKRISEWDSIFERIQPSIAAAIGDWNAALAGNWRDLDVDEIIAIVRWMGRHPVCLVWVPRIDVVREVVRTRQPNTALDTLVRHRPAIVADLRTALLEAADYDHLTAETRALRESVDVLEAGHPWAAQALTSSAFTSLLHGQFGEAKLYEILQRAERTENPLDLVMGEVRLHAILISTAEALQGFGPGKTPEIPPGFNRHNTAHRLTPEQFTEGKALAGLLLSVALLREAHARRDGVSIADATLN